MLMYTRTLAALTCGTLAVAMATLSQSRALALSEQAPPPAQAGAVSEAARQQILDFHSKDENGGSAEAGRPLFEQKCAACHRFGGIGKDVGPDLSTITSRFKKRDVLDSILWPSKVISEQYQSEMMELANGTVVVGVLMRESPTALFVRTQESPEKPVSIPKSTITNRAPSTVSLMPEGLINTLSQKDIADLLSFIMAPPPEK